MIDFLDRRPLIVAVAGPNGAGKSTYYHVHLAPSGLRYVNVDDLATLSNIDSYRAAEAADRLRCELVERKQSFIFETVFSDPVGDKLAFLQRAERAGYTVVLIFIGLDGADISEERVALRVMKGGHDVPTDKLTSRYRRVMANLSRSLKELSNVFVYDNSDLRDAYRLVATLDAGTLQVYPPTPAWLHPLLP